MRNTGLEEAQAGIKIAGRNIITSDMQMIPPLWQKVKRNGKVSWWNERGEWKSWLKAQHSENEDHGTWSHHFMGNRWGNSGNCQTLFFGAPKSLQMVIAAMKLRRLLLGRKIMTNLDSIFKSRDITFPTKVRLAKAMVLCMDVKVGLWRKLSTEELMLLNCGVGEDSWESLGLQGDPSNPS